MKYSGKFEKDFEWYSSVKHIFNFDGTKEYFSKKGNPIIVENPKGKTAKECFYLFDSQGKIHETKDPKKLHELLKTKGSVNLHIKMYAEDRAKGVLPKIEFIKICEEINAPEWFVKAVEKQKYKYYENN